MDKAVLISIRPKWVEKITSSKKTLEVRKNRPKLELPFKCYIYETQGRTETPWIDEDGHTIFKGRGQVIGEFVCDRIVNLSWEHLLDVTENEVSGSCLPTYRAISYLAGNGGYGWHISDLKIYETPKELTEFRTWKKCKSCSKSGYESTACIYDENCMVPVAITKAPQSWCYVEELQ